MIRWLPAISLLLLSTLAALPALAEEYIRAYDVDIEIAESGDLTVSETITVNAEGDRIRRGIFRDFPLTMRDAAGRRQRVGFDLVSVTRDGQNEPYHTESVTGGIRIYAGSEDELLDEGEHTYVLTYRTDRQIRYFDDHDELYWNVTGNGWQFPIARASARVTLPAGEVTQTAAYTGPVGSTARNARIRANRGETMFATTRPLGEEEGLTIVVGFPKGIVAPPSAEQERQWWLRDNINVLLSFGGLVLVVGYYSFFWNRVGRDPARGVMVPRWDPPEGLSPALVNYIDNKGFSGGGWTAFSASALDLAVKGFVTLEDLTSRIVIRRTDKPAPRNLPAGQASLLGSLGGKGHSLVIDEAHGKRVQSIGASFRQAIEKEHRGRYYKANTAYIVGGVLLSVLSIMALIVVGDLEPDMIALLIMPAFLSVFIALFAVRFGRRMRRGATLASRIMSVVGLGFVGLVALSIGSTLIVALMEELTGSEHWPVLTAVGGIVLANVMFFFLMGAPTPLGRKLMDGIEGLRTYLTLAERDRMNMAGAPNMSPAHFETLLPYAVALGVERPWSQAFETWLASAAAGAAVSYAPDWYSGGDYGSGVGDHIGAFASSMGSTIASTIPAPETSSSSSGFSGGSSGGGGGGGGGGGW